MLYEFYFNKNNFIRCPWIWANNRNGSLVLSSGRRTGQTQPHQSCGNIAMAGLTCPTEWCLKCRPAEEFLLHRPSAFRILLCTFPPWGLLGGQLLIEFPTTDWLWSVSSFSLFSKNLQASWNQNSKGKYGQFSGFSKICSATLALQIIPLPLLANATPTAP